MQATKLQNVEAGAATKRRLHIPLGQTVLHGIFIVWSCLAIIPFIWMVFASLKHFRELVTSRDLLPHVWTLENYQLIIQRVGFPAAFRNSLLISISITAATVFTSAYLGYIFAKYRFPGKEAIFMILLATMMVPGAVVLVPLYITIAHMRLANQLGGIVITGLWSTFGVFMLRQFMESLPGELLDAARIDGASEWRIFFTIVIPLSAAPMGALAVFAYLGSWDNLLWPMIVLTSPDKQTLPIVLAGLRSIYSIRYELWSAGSMLTVAPVMLIYIFASKYMIKGVAMSGMKL